MAPEEETTPRGSWAFVTMLLCVVCWSISGLFIKVLTWHPMVIAGLRSVIAALFMLTVNAAGGKGIFAGLSAGGARPALIAAFVLASGASRICYVAASKLTIQANAILLFHTAPVWALALGGLLLKERLRGRQWLGFLCVMAGMALFLWSGLSLGGGEGNALALLGGVCHGAGIVFLRMNRRGSPLLCLLLSHCLNALLAAPFLALYPPVFSPLNTAAILALGIVQMGAASLLYSYSIKRLRAVDAGLIGELEPVLNPLWVFLILGEVPGPMSLAGGLIIIIGVLLSAVAPAHDEHPKTPPAPSCGQASPPAPAA